MQVVKWNIFQKKNKKLFSEFSLIFIFTLQYAEASLIPLSNQLTDLKPRRTQCTSKPRRTQFTKLKPRSQRTCLWNTQVVGESNNQGCETKSRLCFLLWINNFLGFLRSHIIYPIQPGLIATTSTKTDNLIFSDIGLVEVVAIRLTKWGKDKNTLWDLTTFTCLTWFF